LVWLTVHRIIKGTVSFYRGRQDCFCKEPGLDWIVLVVGTRLKYCSLKAGLQKS